MTGESLTLRCRCPCSQKTQVIRKAPPSPQPIRWGPFLLDLERWRGPGCPIQCPGSPPVELWWLCAFWIAPRKCLTLCSFTVSGQVFAGPRSVHWHMAAHGGQWEDKGTHTGTSGRGWAAWLESVQLIRPTLTVADLFSAHWRYGELPVPRPRF